MPKKEKESCCSPTMSNLSACKVESVIAVDERGQMVLPKEVREKANIKPGDKLALISWEKDGKVCCLSLIKAEDLIGMVQNVLGPMMQELIKK